MPKAAHLQMGVAQTERVLTGTELAASAAAAVATAAAAARGKESEAQSSGSCVGRQQCRQAISTATDQTM
eukprot:2190796-Alexandrium_andersonii.AAC.1